MRKYNINKLENKFHVTIYTKRNTLINIIKWCKDNNIKNPTPVNKKIPATVRLRKDRSFRTIKRKNRLFLILILKKNEFLMFKNTWLS